jgi:tripartite-type tricarboxylate transporter receptor subunit TctC
MAFATAGSAMPHVMSGRLRAVAGTSAQPTALAPGLPAIAASGLPGYEVVSSQAVFAPAGTPASIINRLNSEIVRVLNGADIKEKFFNLGVETVGDSPQECAAAIKAEMAKMGKLIKKTGIHGQ